MKSILTSLLTLISCWSLAQAKLSISNPEPRVDDEIMVRCSLEDTGETVAHVTIESLPRKPGPVRIGPFKLTVNGKTYETDVLEVNIAPKLPEVTDGVWVRLINFKEEKYLIIEQRVTWKTENTFEESLKNRSERKYAELKTELLKENGIEIDSRLKSSQGHSGAGVTVKYNLEVFKLKIPYTIPNRVKIDRQSFKNFPEEIELADVWIE